MKSPLLESLVGFFVADVLKVSGPTLASLGVTLSAETPHKITFGVIGALVTVYGWIVGATAHKKALDVVPTSVSIKPDDAVPAAPVKIEPAAAPAVDPNTTHHETTGGGSDGTAGVASTSEAAGNGSGKAAAGLAIALFLVFGAGCANTTTTTFTQDKEGGIHISSGKDIEADNVDVHLSNGTTIHAEKYTSKANPNAIAAEGNRESGNVNASGAIAATAVKGAVEGVAASTGISAVGAVANGAGTAVTTILSSKGH